MPTRRRRESFVVMRSCSRKRAEVLLESPEDDSEEDRPKFEFVEAEEELESREDLLLK